MSFARIAARHKEKRKSQQTWPHSFAGACPPQSVPYCRHGRLVDGVVAEGCRLAIRPTSQRLLEPAWSAGLARAPRRRAPPLDVARAEAEPPVQPDEPCADR